MTTSADHLSGDRVELPLTEQEEALWLLDRFAPEDGVANIGIAADVRGEVRWWPMRSALDWLVRRHQLLRSVIRADRSSPVRALLPFGEATIPLHVRSARPEQVEDELRDLSGGPFDLARGPLLRAFVIDLGPDGQVFLLVGHHLVLDARSATTVLADLWTAYDSFVRSGTEPILPEAQPPGDVLPPSKDSLRFWDERMAGLDPASMRLDGSRDVEDRDRPSFAGARIHLPLSDETTAAVRALRQRLHLSDNVVLLGMYLLLLARHGAGPDLVVGVPMSSRRSSRDETVGHFFSTVPLAVPVGPEDTVADFLCSTRDEVLAVLPHRAVSFEAMVRRLPERRSDWRSPLFRQVFNFWPGTPASSALREGLGHVRQVDTGYSRVELEFTLGAGSSGGWQLQVTYSRDAHDEGFVRRLADRYEKLVQAAAADPDRLALRLPMAVAADSVVARSNDTTVAWPAPATVAGMVADQAGARPDAVALQEAAGSCGYGELQARARAWAGVLADAGVGAGDVVALALPRSAAAAAAALGAWYAGAAYLPLDPRHPRDRLVHQIADAGAAVLVAEPAVGEQLRTGLPVLAAPGPGPGRTEPDPEPDANSVAYVIYTSGSSGRPKGVRITHGNLANVVRHFAGTLGSGPGRSMLWLTTFAFDISALELFVPLSTGGRVVVADDEDQTRPDSLLKLVRDGGVDAVQATPTTWRLVTATDTGDTLAGRLLLVGGEPMPAPLADRLVATGATVHNVYGPTETTIWSTSQPVYRPSAGRPPAVGRPIANTTVHVLDGYGDECGVGIAGDVVIAGAGVARDYLGRPELTAASFMPAFRAGRAYRTGDRGLWRPDGTLELLGRTDRQVKLHGHRVELGEVEAVLEEHPDVRSAAVVVREAGLLTESLAAFVVPTGPEVVTADVWEFAARRLPGYSVPSTLTAVAALPTNSSGKVDHRALAALPVEAVAAAAPGPGPTGDADRATADVEAFLVATWRELLAEPAIQTGSNFFLSGGQSLVAIAVSERVRHRYGVDLPIAAYFTHPTPRRLATRITQLRSAGDPGART